MAFTTPPGAKSASPIPILSVSSQPCLPRLPLRFANAPITLFLSAIADTGENLVAPVYTVDLGDRAVCHRNASFGATEAVFLSTRLVEDRFGLAFEFFINVAHNFIEAAGVPDTFSSLVWSQAEAQVRGETSQDAWEARRRALEHGNGVKRPEQNTLTSAPGWPSWSRRSPILSPFTCSRSLSISTTMTCASAITRCSLRRPSPSGSATSPLCSRPMPASSSRFTTGVKARAVSELT